MPQQYFKIQTNDEWNAIQTICVIQGSSAEASEWCTKWNETSDKKVFFQETTYREYLSYANKFDWDY